MTRSYYDNDDLLESIKLRIQMPVDQISFSDSDILLLASEEVEMELLPNIMRTREEFYVYCESQTINATGRYPIPYRAVGGKVREVFLTSGSGTSKQYFKVGRVSVENIPEYNSDNSNSEEVPLYYVENNDIVFTSSINTLSADSVEIRFYMRPNRLAEKAQTLTVKSINTVTGVIDVEESQISSNFLANAVIDFIQARPGYKTKGYDVTLVTVSPNVPLASQKTITIAPADIPDGLVVGDYIAIAEESPVAQLPQDLQPMLAQTTACRVLEALGDLDNLDRATKKLELMQKRLFNLIEDRTEGNPKKIVNRNGILSSGSRYGRYRR